MGIHLILDFIVNELNQYLASRGIGTGVSPFVEYIDIQQDPPGFQNQKISLLLINLEEEQLLHPPNRFQVRLNGEDYPVSPPLRLNLLILLAIKQNQYFEAMKMMSSILGFFQANPIFHSKTFPGLPKEVDKLTIELVSQSPSQQNEVWSMLKTAYLPSLVYKIKMIVIQEDPLVAKAPVKNIQYKMKG